MYKIFLVEDEIITREGIRDAIDWQEMGFLFVGDAPDGEIALPLIKETQPDIVITDIKMPFMDGLELSRILQQYTPKPKIVILSGHDEFEFAKRAIQLGVSEYLLKPVTRQELIAVLQKVAAQIDVERQERDYRLDLLAKSSTHQELLQEKLVRRLVTGGIEITEALEQGSHLKLNLLAEHYLVIVVKFVTDCDSLTVNYKQYQSVQDLLASMCAGDADIVCSNKDLDETVLILMGKDHASLEEKGRFISDLIIDTVQQPSSCQIQIGTGTVCERLTRLDESYARAQQTLIDQSSSQVSGPLSIGTPLEPDFALLKREAIEHYLYLGNKENFDSFFVDTFLPIRDAIENSQFYCNYILTHFVFTCAHFVKDLGGIVTDVLPKLNEAENRFLGIKSLDNFKDRILEYVMPALEFRDGQASHLHSSLIWKAKAYLQDNSHDSTLSLHAVADHIGLSASYFSSIFSREVGETFVEHLTKIRIERAKELLRSTNMYLYEIAEAVGYNDPHYFSTAFKRVTGHSPSHYRKPGTINTHED